MKISSCIVNPRACHETILNYEPAEELKRIAVVGAGPAGLAAATLLAERGHDVHLFEAAKEIGGQFNMAKVIPGKEEYQHTIRYYAAMIEKHDVQLHLNHRVTADELIEDNYDDIILATGVTPRKISFAGANHENVLSYADVLYKQMPVGKRVAVVGAGGIGFDVAEFLAHNKNHESPSLNTEAYMQEWGVDMAYKTGGALTQPKPIPSPREIFLLKRSGGKHGKDLGKTTGWIHRASLQMKGVQNISNCTYVQYDGTHFHLEVNGEPKSLEVDNIVICAGQEPLRDLYDALIEAEQTVHLIGGALKSEKLDAKVAIKQASELAAKL
jgi:2,4-dienoyl-CoA reductase (NADPH2)